jgi:DNA segregation ATPase FtsK/SpoIIIE, S-DNA-T family
MVFINTFHHSLLIIFAAMANKLKSTTKKNAADKPAKTTAGKWKAEKEEKVDLKKFARDERTWKIAGTVLILISVFLFIAFISYFFTWKKDYAEVTAPGFLINNDIKVANLLGRLGAFVAHFFVYKGFGVAALLVCTFFFIVGANFLFNKKVFSIWRNLRYVLVGLLVISVSMAFIFSTADFPFGGGVGLMISNWMQSFIGTIGTASILMLAFVSYLIWQFNPVFQVPRRKSIENIPGDEEEKDAVLLPGDEDESSSSKEAKGNKLKSQEDQLPIKIKKEEGGPEFEIIEHGEDEQTLIPSPVEDEVVNEIMHTREDVPEITIKDNRLENRNDSIDGVHLEIKPSSAEEQDESATIEKGYKDLPPYEPTLDLRDYKYPGLALLETHSSEKIVHDPKELENNKDQIINTLKNYDINIQKISATVGPTVTLYEIVPAAGVRISRIKNLEDDIALSLAALGIRIIAPIPGKGTIGIEVPNVKKSIVSMKALLASEKFQHNAYSLPIAIGKKIDNENFIVDLASMPHLLMAGATGQGKSVGLNAILVSLLYKKHPSQLKLVLIDPKKVELSLYRVIEKHFLAKLPGEEDAIITDTKKVVHTLNALCIEMDNRYDLLKEAGARNIREYNEKFVKRRLNPQKGHQFLPFIVLVVDEFADLIMTAGKEIEMPIARLAQLARAVGIHLIIATQRPSVNIITGTIKANFPSRIAFKVSSKIDSRTILDAGGAEQLIGKGDMLISHNGEITRLQCAFVDTPEVEKVVEFIGDQRGYPQAFLLPEYIDEKDMEAKDFDLADRDKLFEDAARLIVQNQVGSTSLLQRRMKLGYNRAGRLMDQLEAAGIVGPGQGSKARDVLIKTEMDLEEHLSHLS